MPFYIYLSDFWHRRYPVELKLFNQVAIENETVEVFTRTKDFLIHYLELTF